MLWSDLQLRLLERPREDVDDLKKVLRYSHSKSFDYDEVLRSQLPVASVVQ